MTSQQQPDQVQTIAFRAETNQLLNILIHSLYSERDVFLRELISNASDALTRMDFTLLTNRDVLADEDPLSIWIESDPEQYTITIRDNGIGMTAEEMVENLGTIAHSGARAFLQAAQENQGNVSNIIGQFGVGFYSAFMVAEWIRVTSRSYRPDAAAATWYSTGADTFQIDHAEKTDRGTVVVIKLKEDAKEFAQIERLRRIIKKHSDYVPFPILLGEQKEPANQQTALWREQPRKVEAEKYNEFFKQLTLDPTEPIAYAHMNVDAPVQLYALLYVPADPERGFLNLRRQPGLKLYVRKVLIQEYCTDLLPEYLQFVDGVVDSEDLPLNVSRETMQANPVMGQLRKLVTAKVLETLKNLSKDKPETYAAFWQNYQRAIKQGVATDPENSAALLPLLRFHTNTQTTAWVSLDEYTARMKEGQKKIYYLLGDDERSAARSPHLDQFRRGGIEVILLTDPIDSFVVLSANRYQDFDLVNAVSETLEAPAEAGDDAKAEQTPASDEENTRMIERFQSQLGERVSGVRISSTLVESPARLVEAEGALGQEMQRVYRLLNREFEAPAQTLEINPRHPLLRSLSAQAQDSPVIALIIEQIYEDALLIEGLHPDPAGMVERIQKLMAVALDRSANNTE
ncbi:MAG TPA: molecular chaperone HtpG [Anaerolineaceae bacterium]